MDANLLNDFIIIFKSLCKNITRNYDKDNQNEDSDKTILNIIQRVIEENFSNEEFSNFIDDYFRAYKIGKLRGAIF